MIPAPSTANNTGIGRPQTESGRTSMSASKETPANKIRVLLVDDDDNYSALVRDVLGFAEQYELERSSSLSGMWKQLDGGVFHVVLLDYRFPDGSGLDALNQIIEHGLEIPVIMVTGRGDERIAANAIQQGASDYLVKSPEAVFELPVLIRKVVRNYAYQVANRQSLEKIRYQALLLNNVQDAVVVWDSDGRITYWNAAAEELYGLPADAQFGRRVQEGYCTMFDPPPDPTVPGPEGAVLAERRLIRPNRGEAWISSRLAVLRDNGAEGNILGVMDVTRDITQRKRSEGQLLEAQTRLVESARLAAIGELASGVAHQINNPLTAIIAEAQMLSRELPPEGNARESAELIERAGWKAQQAVQDLLEFSRPQQDRLESLSINDSVRMALRMVGAPIQTAGTSLDIRLGEELPSVRAYGGRLQDLWVNLLLLARDATVGGGVHRICVLSYRTRNGEVAVEVADDGTPIPSAELDTLFEPHYAGAVAGRGNGMEYSICREIVRQHGGRIDAVSRSLFGTIIRVAMPAEVNHGTGQHSGH
jgi:PAS domain S-box-containing protein